MFHVVLAASWNPWGVSDPRNPLQFFPSCATDIGYASNKFVSPSKKLTWNLKITSLKRELILQHHHFRGHNVTHRIHRMEYIYHKNSTIHVAKKYTSPMGIPMG